MASSFKYLLIATLVVTLTACKFGPVKKRTDADTADEAQTAMAEGEQGAGAEDQRYGADMGAGFTGQELDDPNSPLSKRVFYFDLDSSQLSVEDRDVIAAHANYLSMNQNVSVVLEGHADERGTREYNIALGERRAKAVLQLLLVQGVSNAQAQVISFGEERPVALDHDASAWRLNRRVEILYSGY
ncbi:MAG: peptidoglycan-associated lipoprotein Pal [Gammaproteobacteria bacterium]|nr:peptidoglycan-associated lipoprotein Pal [Gammaproteobacteria bacterium]